ncbi:hypothetical protein BaRGS_00033489 [Batillaria attramentaria]|uniref:Uncharacterized protein n=1 Tax=Batillaria attramentaria TaxID=370345 RepID=A0ABD0JKI9_9CAEN
MQENLRTYLNQTIHDCIDAEIAVPQTKDSKLDTSDSFVENGSPKGSPKTFRWNGVTAVRTELTNLMNDDNTEANGRQAFSVRVRDLCRHQKPSDHVAFLF